jgi:hypothetical protein
MEVKQIPYEKCHYFEITWHIQNTHRFQDFKLTFADWLKFSLIEALTYEIDVWFQENFSINDALDMVGNLAF